MLLACYVAAHLLHAIVGRWITPARPFAKPLSPDCSEFPAEQKIEIRQALNLTFRLNLPSGAVPERRSARSINVCDRMGRALWRLPADVTCRVQREKTW